VQANVDDDARAAPQPVAQLRQPHVVALEETGFVHG